MGGSKSAPNRSKAIASGKKLSTTAIRVSTPRTAIVPVQLPPLKHRWLSILGAIVLLAGSGSGVVGLGWLSVQLIVNPEAVRWVNQIIPGWNRRSETEQPSRTLQEIRTQLRQRGLTAGELLTLSKGISVLDGRTPTNDVLLPVLQSQAGCTLECDRVVELRVYQLATEPGRSLTDQEKYYLVDQLAITGLEESFAIAPLVEAQSENQGSSRSLPLTRLSRFEGTAPTGIWLNLSGKRTRGDETIAYGQILFYNPKRQHLSSKLQWTSPTGEEPIWKQVVAGGEPELVVNQTIGMEPQFEVYGVKPYQFAPSPLQLEQISLAESALDGSQYRSALLLARNRLWSPSLKWLEACKQRSRPRWSEAAQAQLDLVRWHAQITQNQADGSWASPGQQVLANLIDGRWERAVTVFQSSIDASQETVGMLKGDKGRLENRVKAALQVSPAKFEVKAWGALLIVTQQTEAAAIAWLKKLPKTTDDDVARISALMKRLDPNFRDNQSFDNRTSRIVGEVEAIAQIKPTEWLLPPNGLPLQLATGQTWYRIPVIAFHDDDRWQFAPSMPNTIAAATLWKRLNLDSNAIMQILYWSDGGQQTVWASVKAARVRNGQPELLVAAEAIAKPNTNSLQPRPLAVTEAALQWLSSDSLPLSDWVAQQPNWQKRALPALLGELQRVGTLTISASATWETVAALGVGDWTVQTIALTGSRQPDVILTLHPDSLVPLTKSATIPKPRTLIFSATGKLIYSEFSTEAGLSYLAIADLGDSRPTLIAHTTHHYKLLRWSAARQQFE